MAEKHFGSLNGRHLHLRYRAPYQFTAWDSETFKSRLSPIRLLNPLRWWKAIWCRSNWDVWCRRFDGANHRCYCDSGASFDGRIAIAGFLLQWWYSRFDGQWPCWCDRVSAAMETTYNGQYPWDAVVTNYDGENVPCHDCGDVTDAIDGLCNDCAGKRIEDERYGAAAVTTS